MIKKLGEWWLTLRFLYDKVILNQFKRVNRYFIGGKNMTLVKFYLQAKLHGMRRFSGISVFGAQYPRPNYRLQRNKDWVSFFESEEIANHVKTKLENRYPQITFRVAKDKSSGVDYGWN